MFDSTLQLARRLNRDLVLFSLELCEGPCPHISKLTTLVVTPGGERILSERSVQVPEHIVLQNSASMRAGIRRFTADRAPTWLQVYHELIVPRGTGLWVGFGSRTREMVALHRACQAAGRDPSLLTHLDLANIGGVYGTLPQRLAALTASPTSPEAKTSRQKVGQLQQLLEALLGRTPALSDLLARGDLPASQDRVEVPPVRRARSRCAAHAWQPPCFLTDKPVSRDGLWWVDAEENWVVAQFEEGMSVEILAARTGRVPYGIAWRLFKTGHLTDAQREHYKPLD